MAAKFKIFLADLFHDYRPNHICTPLGVGFVAQYVKASCANEVDIRLFKSPERLLEAIREPDPPHMVGFSNYSWNVEINLLVQRRLAAEFPDTIIIEGGPHIRIDEEGIAAHLRRRSLVDYSVILEGEFPTASLVRHMLSKGRPVKPRDCDTVIEGVAYLHDGEMVYAPRRAMKGELDAIPSPYLSGLMDEFLETSNYLPLIETNRGCPFACTFCAWGISALNKVRKFDTDVVNAEIDYIAKRSQSSHWYFTDANFGMFPRDVEIAKALKKAADASPYLSRVSVNWAKNSSAYCTEIAHILKGVCEPLIAVQSTDTAVLENIKRSNIKMSTITDLVDQGRKDGIAMTTDVLAGLPGETLESHLDTLRDVFAIGFESFNVGQIRMLPGSEMEEPASRERYQIETKFRFIAGFVGIYDGEPVCEYEESIVGTNTASQDDMFTLRMVHFLTWALWNSGLAQPLLRYMFAAEEINPLDGILALTAPGQRPEVQAFLDSYKAEASEEWYDSEEQLIAYFQANHRELLDNEYLKLNLKYLSKILLDRDLARQLIETVAARSASPVSGELVEFCLERIFFIAERVHAKEFRFSPELVRALASIYPTVSADGTTLCRFSISEKGFRIREMELDRFDFGRKPERALALTLQNYGDKMMYDFAFGDEIEKTGSEVFVDTFDYADQLGTHMNHRAR